MLARRGGSRGASLSLYFFDFRAHPMNRPWPECQDLVKRESHGAKHSRAGVVNHASGGALCGDESDRPRASPRVPQLTPYPTKK